jgi:hypothetical protein
MNDAEERFVRWYAHLAADAPLDRHAARALLRRALADREALAEFLLEQCTPALLGEFINRHWNDALSNTARGASLRLASRTLRALDYLEERDRWAVLEWLKRGVVPSARILRRLCEGVNNAR